MPIDSPTNYNLSFTSAALRPELARIVAEHYLDAGNWDDAKVRILSSNALQCRSLTSSTRLEREFRRRLGTLTHDQITVLAQATAEDRAAIAWLAACKHNVFLFEFAAEVLRDKLAVHDPVLRNSDYDVSAHPS
ncbi:BrxA family protein [Bdellovibrionota bacterium FG-2]